MELTLAIVRSLANADKIRISKLNLKPSKNLIHISYRHLKPL
jgi:hypothetical protein